MQNREWYGDNEIQIRSTMHLQINLYNHQVMFVLILNNLFYEMFYHKKPLWSDLFITEVMLKMLSKRIIIIIISWKNSTRLYFQSNHISEKVIFLFENQSDSFPVNLNCIWIEESFNLSLNLFLVQTWLNIIKYIWNKLLQFRSLVLPFCSTF